MKLECNFMYIVAFTNKNGVTIHMLKAEKSCSCSKTNVSKQMYFSKNNVFVQNMLCKNKKKIYCAATKRE